MSDEEGQQENEGQDEVVLEEQVTGEEVVADEDLGALGMVPEKQGEPTKKAEAEEDKNEEEGGEEEEVPVDPNDPALAERVIYIRQLREFFKELSLYYRGKRLPKGGKELAAIKRAFQEEGQEQVANATYSANGKTLTLLNRNGKLKYTMQMQPYRPPTREEQEAALEKQKRQIAKAEGVYEMAIAELHRVSKTAIHGDIKTAQRRVAEADRLIQSLKHPERAITTYESIEIREIDFDRPFDVHKILAYALHVGSQKLQKTYAVPSEEEAEEAPPPEEVLGAKKRVVIFAGKPLGTYDFLSSFYVSPFEYKGHEYTTAYQAIMATMAGKFGEDETAEEIQNTEDPEAIDLTWDKVEGATQKTWNMQLESTIIKINRAKFAKNPKLAARLLKTGEARIAAVPPENETDAFQGIGLTEENPNALKKSRWKGKNIYGMALEQIREELAAVAVAEPTTKPRQLVRRVAATTTETTTAAPVPTTEPTATQPRRLLRRFVPLSATETASAVASKTVAVATQGVRNAATAATAAVAQGASNATAAVAQGASNATAAVAQGATAATAAVAQGASTAAEVVAQGASVVAQGASAAAKVVAQGVSNAATAVVKKL
uniref:NADAR domain-containing protein n=1 Tax=viral metagenome TaxID=1070528 RepID=A0A6C0K0X6_9ZZZZ